MATAATQFSTFLNVIDGEWQSLVSGEPFENRNPANTDDLIGVFQKSTQADVDRAIDAARLADV